MMPSIVVGGRALWRRQMMVARIGKARSRDAAAEVDAKGKAGAAGQSVGGEVAGRRCTRRSGLEEGDTVVTADGP